MVHLQPGRLKLRLRLASRRDEAFLDESELPPLRQPKPGPPARIITRREEMASNAAWARARLHEKLRGAVSWTEAAGLGAYGAVLLLLGRHVPDGAADGLPLRDPASPVPTARGGSDPAMQLAEAGATTDTGAEVPGTAMGAEAAPVPGWAPGWAHGTGLAASAAASPLEGARFAAADGVLPAMVRPVAVEDAAGARLMAAVLQADAGEEMLPASFRGAAQEAAAAAAARVEAAKAAALGSKAAAQGEAAARPVQPAEAPAVAEKAEAAAVKLAVVAEAAAAPAVVTHAAAKPAEVALKPMLLAENAAFDPGPVAGPIAGPASAGVQEQAPALATQHAAHGLTQVGPELVTMRTVVPREAVLQTPAELAPLQPVSAKPMVVEPVASVVGKLATLGGAVVGNQAADGKVAAVLTDAGPAKAAAMDGHAAGVATAGAAITAPPGAAAGVVLVATSAVDATKAAAGMPLPGTVAGTVLAATTTADVTKAAVAAEGHATGAAGTQLAEAAVAANGANLASGFPADVHAVGGPVGSVGVTPAGNVTTPAAAMPAVGAAAVAHADATGGANAPAGLGDAVKVAAGTGLGPVAGMTVAEAVTGPAAGPAVGTAVAEAAKPTEAGASAVATAHDKAAPGLAEVAKPVDAVVAAVAAQAPATHADSGNGAATVVAHETAPAQVAEAVKPAAAASLPIEVIAAHAPASNTPKAEVTTAPIVLATEHPALDASQAALPVTPAHNAAPLHVDTLEQLSPAMAAAHPLLAADPLLPDAAHGIDLTASLLQAAPYDMAFA